MARHHRSPGKRLQQVFVTLVLIGSTLVVPVQEPSGAAALRMPGEAPGAAPPVSEVLPASQATAAACDAAAQFDVTWSSACDTPPAGAVTALGYAAGLWGAWLRSPVTITVTACWTTSVDSGALADGEPQAYYRNFARAPLVDVVYPVSLANALAGEDLDPTQSDISMHFQSAESWDFSPDGTGVGTYDFVSVALHELGHGLGFLGNMVVEWNVGFCSTGRYGYLYPCPTPYDYFAVDGTGTTLLSIIDVNPLVAGASLQSDTRFGGPNTIAANGGAARLYTPGTWEQGSSLSHLDGGTFAGNANRLMTPTYSDATLAPGPVTLAMMQDMGWPRNDGVPSLATSGGMAAGAGQPAAFAAALSWPGYTGQPMAYTWTATASGPVAHAGRGVTDTVALTWGETGVKTITATVNGGAITASAVRSVLVVDLTVGGPATGAVGSSYTFNAALAPSGTALPITYEWQGTEAARVVHPDLGTTDSAAFRWSAPGAKVVTVSATIAGTVVRAVHTVEISGTELDHHVYLPLTLAH